MDRTETDAPTTSEVWRSSLNATCNRLSTQYLNLLKSASGNDASRNEGRGIQNDPRSGGGIMRDPNEPPAPLAADTALASLQTELSAQNLCVASAHLLDLIRTLRLSALLMEENSILEEEAEEYENERELSRIASVQSATLEAEYVSVRDSGFTVEE